MLPPTISKMASNHRSGTNVLILLLHLLGLITFAGDILYQRYNVSTLGAKSWGGRLKYLTYINEV